MTKATITPTTMDRVNINLMFNSNPLGSEIETNRGPGVVTGYRLYKGELVFSVAVKNESGKEINVAVQPINAGLQLISNPEDIAEVSKTTKDAIDELNDGLPQAVETKRESAAAFEFSGKRLRAMRVAMNLTQVFVAEYLGMAKSSSAAIGDWEAERNKVPVKHQAKLIDLYTPKDEEELEEYDEEDEGIDANEPSEEGRRLIEEHNARIKAEADEKREQEAAEEEEANRAAEEATAAEADADSNNEAE